MGFKVSHWYGDVGQVGLDVYVINAHEVDFVLCSIKYDVINMPIWWDRIIIYGLILYGVLRIDKQLGH